MRKKDRTSEEKHWDGMVKTAIMALGTNPASMKAQIPFPYVLVWDTLGRKGQRCKVLRRNPMRIQVQFEDGYTATLDRRAIRQY